MKIFQTRRNMPVSPQKIFKAFEDPALLTKWWGPDGFTTTSNSFEFRPDGIWKCVMHGPDGKDYPNEMIFQEIVAPHRIVMRHSVEPFFTLTVTIESSAGGAIVNWQQDFDSEEVARKMAPVIKPANEQNLDKLQSLVANA